MEAAPREAAGASQLPRTTLVRLAAYWLGIAALWAGLSPILAGRLEFERLVPAGTEGTSLFRILAIGGLIAVILQPAVGAVSDHATSRWGPRRPFIVAGALLDVVFLVGIATSNSLLAISAFVLALQVSSNVAQGPYQGYVPDLTPPTQVGFASGLIGLMLVLGNLIGYLIGAAAIGLHQYAAATILLGVIEVAAMVVLVTTSHRAARVTDRSTGSRSARAWLAIGLRAWSPEILRNRSFVWFVVSRLLILTGGSVLTSLAPFYLARAFDLGEAAVGSVIVALVGIVALGTALSVLPGARLSDRIGRRSVIWVSCALGAAGLLACAAAPTLPVAFVGAGVFGVSIGIFLAVDWALLSELVPREEAGRFMGISNVASGSAGVLAAGLGGTVMDLVGGPGQDGSGPRAALLAGAVAFVLGAIALRGVHEPRYLAPARDRPPGP